MDRAFSRIFRAARRLRTYTKVGPANEKKHSRVEIEQGSVVVSKFHGLIFQAVSEKVLGRVYLDSGLVESQFAGFASNKSDAIEQG